MRFHRILQEHRVVPPIVSVEFNENRALPQPFLHVFNCLKLGIGAANFPALHRCGTLRLLALSVRTNIF